MITTLSPAEVERLIMSNILPARQPATLDPDCVEYTSVEKAYLIGFWMGANASLSTKQIAERLHASPNSVYVMIRRLQRRAADQIDLIKGRWQRV